MFFPLQVVIADDANLLVEGLFGDSDHVGAAAAAEGGGGEGDFLSTVDDSAILYDFAFAATSSDRDKAAHETFCLGEKAKTPEGEEEDTPVFGPPPLLRAVETTAAATSLSNQHNLRGAPLEDPEVEEGERDEEGKEKEEEEEVNQSSNNRHNSKEEKGGKERRRRKKTDSEFRYGAAIFIVTEILYHFFTFSDPPVPSKRLYACSFCPKRFPSRHYLRFHESSVHRSQATSDDCGNSNLSCPDCGRAFAAEYYLRQHRRRMHTDRRHRCPRCPAAFAVAYDLVVHGRNVHPSPEEEVEQARRKRKKLEAEEPSSSSCPPQLHRCSSCGRRLASARALRDHERTHTGEKPYPCPHPGCGRRFALAKTLRVHFRQHSGERPYACPRPGCGRTFVQNSTLRSHVRNNHREWTEGRGKAV